MQDDNIKKGLLKDVLRESLNKSKRVIRIFIIISLLTIFFFIGFIPTKSMEPYLMGGDLLVFSKNINKFKRGDIVSFKSPVEDEIYVKRIIGLPGETISIEEGFIYIDGVMIEDFTSVKATYTMSKTVIEDGEYFVLGDNRNNSLDSSEYGAIKKEAIKGKGILILMPINRIQVLNE